jgi:RimJ/RimL family protein N-acetyltransferase
MRLSDGTVTLRAHEPADLDDLVVMANDPATVESTTVPHPYTRAQAEQWTTEHVPAMWRDGTGFGWAVEAHDDGRPRFAGNLDIRAAPGGVPDIGYVLAPWARGRGIMARAVRLGTAHAFSRGLPVVHWATHAGNLASWRVAHACGFTFHGERPMSVPHRGELRDGWWASLRAGDAPAPRTTWWPVPELVGERVRLRAHTGADLPRIVEACSDARTRHWLVGLPAPYTDDDARAFVRGARLAESLGQEVTWAVADLTDDRLLGNVGVFDLATPLNPTGGEIGYWAHPSARGRGVLTEAVGLVVAHAFRPVADGGLGRHRLQIGTAWDNTASRRVAERNGFALAARFRLDGVEGDPPVLGDGAWYERLAGDGPPPAR